MAETNKRDVSVMVRMTDDERSMLAAVAERRGLTRADIVRQCIRACYREEFGETEPKRQRRTKK